MTPYPTKKNTPSRKTRKGLRNSVFIENYVRNRRLRSARRRERKAALESAE